MNIIPALSSYAKLLEAARRALAAGRERARRAVEGEKVRTYWELGRLVNQHLRIHDGRAGYGERLIPRLAFDLAVGDRLLWKIVHFQEAFPILPTRRQNLDWSQYELLSSIQDPRQRGTFYRKAVRQGLNVRELASELKKHKVIVPGEGKAILKLTGTGVVSGPLKPRRGTLYTYRVVKPSDLHERPDFYSIDLGFKTRMDMKLSGLKGIQEGSLIEALRTEENPRGDRYRFRKTEARSGSLYTYKAQVQRVIDADTLWAFVDLGFRVWTQQKLRFRGINAAEQGDGGRKATRYVTQLLSQIPFVVVKLSSRDKFNRYLTDLFYLKGESDPQKVLEKGNFLNQELLDKGLARLV